MQFKPLIGLTYETYFTLANTLILFFILKKILFKPVLKVMDEREMQIKMDIDEGNKAREEGLKFKSEYETKVGSARSKGQQIVEIAKKRAEEKSDEIISKAKQDAEIIKVKALDEIDKEKQQAFNDIKNEISDMAIMAASKVVQKDIDKTKHEDLINEFIKEVGESK